MRKSDLPARPFERLAHSIADVTKIIGLGRSFIYEEIAAGRLPIKKAGRRTIIGASDLEAWFDGLPRRLPPAGKQKSKIRN